MDLLTITPKTHVVITGGAGFIGFQLSARLLAAGARVTILTRHTETPRALALAKQGASMLSWDCSSSLPPSDCDRLASAQIFYHLAADVAVTSPTLRRTNIEGTHHALDLADTHKIPYFIYASSIEAQGLGSDEEGPLSEAAPCRPVSDYGVSKADAEGIVTRWAESSNKKALILRIGNIYGPGSAWFLHPCLMALIGLSPLAHVWPRLHHRRFQPLYLDDLVEGMLRATRRELTGIYNLTGEEPMSIGDYVHSLASLIGLTDQLTNIHGPWQGQEPPLSALAPDFGYFLLGSPDRCHRLYDNTRIRREIGDYARWSMARGLAATLNWYYSAGMFAGALNAARRERGHTCMSH